MFQRLRKSLLMWNEKRSVRAAIKLAVTAVYSESSNMSSVVQAISRNESGIELARAYIAVQVAAGLTGPLADADIDHAIEELRISQEQLGQAAFERHLERHRELAEQRWSRKRITILDGKRAFREDEWSYAGVLYAMEDAKKGPLSTSERKQVRKLINDAAEAERKLAEYARSRTSPGSTECLEREIADLRRQLADLEGFNSPEMLYTRAMMFFEGDDCPQDYVQAAQLCMAAAKQGLAMAQHALALMYENGHGMPRSYSEAARWYHKAAGQGYAGSQNNLGVLFETGCGVARDYGHALELYRMAADNGDENARENRQRLELRLREGQERRE
jgi:TPR repeat protein